MQRIRRNSMKEELRLVCLVKFVPDVDAFSYDFAHNQLNRNYVRMILNPDDACALAFALQVKKTYPSTRLEVVTMAPRSVEHHMLDLLRLHVDGGYMLTDPLFAGSDTYATTTILSSFLSQLSYDCILTGTRSLDGATSHVPSQLAEALGLDHMQDISRIDLESIKRQRPECTVEYEEETVTYAMDMPAILSLTRTSGYKLPYIAYEDFEKDVSDRLTFITHEQLECSPAAIGFSGSLTHVVDTFAQEHERRNRTIVQSDEAGIEYVYAFLKKQRYM